MQTEWLLRRQKTNGLFFDFSVGAGVSKTFLDGATYEIDTDSKAQKVNTAGDTYVLTSIAWTVGYNMDLKKKDKLRFYLKPSLMAFFPYNNFFYVRPTAELGLIYNLNNFWKTSPKLFKK